MSAYGPALFVTRKDGAAMPEDEQRAVLALARAAAERLRLRDEEREPAVPDVYDYDGYEPRALGILLYSGYAYGEMPEEIQRDQEETWSGECARVGAEIERQSPGRYTFTGYGVED
ncbi:hypothetical protein KZZ52_13390 [Dactylosporangium sp. AC04546]|uniref:hypothetical protein n=1 Tax=Dactylosporangium sp. AC04546 TaxID=2862460 RepID=UPI001EDFE09E|nr:hypothetical protein [Dactylosporangium sp. AC04546]WVK86321.1 hypothetical protein KZZ52_13390 [Dactylosporangium sp. AC04546]